MRRPAFIGFMALLLAWSALPIGTGAASSGSLIKASGPAVYYLFEGKRYVFPNERIYFSWYADFSSVETVSGAELASYQLGGNVTYRPGARLVKLQTDPKTYAVDRGGRLRWVTSEEVARRLYGDDWNTKVDDVSDAYFLDYRVGEAVSFAEDFDAAGAAASAGIFEDIRARSEAPSASGEGSMEFRAKVSGDWSDPKTWGGRVPGSGASVVVPQGVEVVYDASSSGSLRSLDIDGRLTFSTEASTVLAARMIDVGGALVVGTAEEPVPAGVTATIRLTAASPFAISDDGLRVHGSLDLHGHEPAVAWTRLAKTASAGAVSIALTEAPDWRAGDEIVIASGTSDPHEAETRVLTAVDGGVVSFDEPLEHAHRGDEVFSTEVGLLTRNVRVLGAGEGQGSYVVASGRASARVAGAEFRGLGRSGSPGHYALYFDGLGPAADSYLRKSSVVASGNRCAVVRQTHAFEIDGLVAYDVRGHCIAAVEGAETENVWRGNLVVLVRAGSSPTGDGTPAAFYVRHPGTALLGNAAAGGEGHGIWYDLPESAVRSDGSLQRPREAPLGPWAANRSHSQRGDGLRVDGANEEQNYSPASTASFAGLVSAMNGGHGFWMRGSDLEVARATLAGNRVGGAFAAFAATFRDSLVVGDLDGLPAAALAGGSELSPRYGFAFLDGPVLVSGVTFRDFESSEDRPAAAFTFHAPNPRVPDPRNAYRGVVLENAEAWHASEPEAAGDYLSLARDADAGKTVASYEPFLDHFCEHEDGSALMSCPGRYAQLTAVFRGGSKKENARFTRADTGAVFTLYVGEAFDGEYAYLPLVEGGTYRVSGPTARSLSFDWSGALDPVTLVFKAPASASVRVNGGPPAAGVVSHDAGAGELSLRLDPGAYADIVW